MNGIKRSIVLLVGLAAIITGGYFFFIDERDADDGATYYSEFPEEYLLKGEGYVVEDALMRYPFRVCQRGEYLYLLDLHGEENFCHVLCKADMKCIVSFAQRGSAPNEVLQANNIYVGEENQVWIFDAGNRRVSRWRCDFEQATAQLQETIPIREKMVYSSNCTWNGDSIFYFTDKTGDNRILVCSRSGEVIAQMGSIPAKGKIKDGIKGTVAQAWDAYIHYNPQLRLMAIVTQLGDVVEIYDLKSGTEKVLKGVWGEPQYRVTHDNHALPIGIMGYSDVQVTEKYIYAVFHGRTFKEIANDPYNTPDGGKYIHVYKHDGTPVCRLVLDHEIYGIDVDEENGVIWATNVNTEEQIVRYALPHTM